MISAIQIAVSLKYFFAGSQKVLHLRLIFKKNKQIMLTSAEKKKIFKQFGGSETNTGSTEAQIALFTEQINFMTEHMKSSPKDFSTERTLITLVGKRKSLLNYLHRTDINKYRSLIAELNIRK